VACPGLRTLCCERIVVNMLRCGTQSRRAIWQSYVPPANAPTKMSGAFTGTVTEVGTMAGASLNISAPRCMDQEVSQHSIAQRALQTPFQVVSGDCLVVNDAAAGAERRVFLSSIRAPRIGRREEKSEPYAAEAKEFLRNRLIGEELPAHLMCMPTSLPAARAVS
jgi:hypothetical protein